MEKNTKMKAPTKEALREQLVTQRNVIKQLRAELSSISELCSKFRVKIGSEEDGTS
jgi:hypothetical protein